MVDEIIRQFKADRSNLIPILQRVQDSERFVSQEAIEKISRFLDISENDIFSVASFYPLFRFTRPGEHTVKVCQGTACHVRGSPRILEALERELGIRPGCTTNDFKFSLERAACFGCCALSPVIVIDQDVYSRMTPTRVKEVLESYK
jgi:NADH-quinone oxidoreductase subunit E